MAPVWFNGEVVTIEFSFTKAFIIGLSFMTEL